MAQRDEPPEPHWEKLLPVLAPVLASLLVAVTYAFLRGNYVRFYAQFGVYPEDVGLGQQQLLAGALRFFRAGSFSAKYTPLNFTLIVVGLIAAWVTIARYIARRFTLRTTMSRVLVQLSVGAVLLLAVLLFFYSWAVPKDRNFAQRRISSGRSIHPNELAFLTILAHPASVSWMKSDSTPAPKGFPSDTANIVYLGHDDDMITIYDPSTAITWRIPKDKAIVRIRTEFEEKTDL